MTMKHRHVCAIAAMGLLGAGGAFAQSDATKAVEDRAPAAIDAQAAAKAAAAAAKQAAEAAERATAAAEAAAKVAERLNALLVVRSPVSPTGVGQPSPAVDKKNRDAAVAAGFAGMPAKPPRSGAAPSPDIGQAAAAPDTQNGASGAINILPTGTGVTTTGAERYSGAQQPTEDIRRIQGTEIYGTTLPFLNIVGEYGATTSQPKGGPSLLNAQSYTAQNQPSRFRLDGIALLGFRGRKTFTDDLSALYQVESSYDTAGNQQGTIGSRNSGVALSSKRFGTVLAGIWDTPYQYLTQKAAAVRGNSSFDYGNVIGTPGFNVPVSLTRASPDGSKADAGFNRRQGNIVQYWSPSLYHFSARLAYSTNAFRTASTGPASPSVNPYILSAALSYDNGPFTARYAYENHRDYFGLAQLGVSSGAGATVSPAHSVTNTKSNDWAHKVYMQYEYDNSRLLGIWERLEYTDNDSKFGMVNMYRRDAFYVMEQSKFGKHVVWVGYGVAGAGVCSKTGGGACVTSGLDGRMLTIGYLYNISSSFDIYAAAFTVRNGASGQYGIYPTLGSGTAPGANYRGIGVGMLAVFN